MLPDLVEATIIDSPATSLAEVPPTLLVEVVPGGIDIALGPSGRFVDRSLVLGLSSLVIGVDLFTAGVLSSLLTTGLAGLVVAGVGGTWGIGRTFRRWTRHSAPLSLSLTATGVELTRHYRNRIFHHEHLPYHRLTGCHTTGRQLKLRLADGTERNFDFAYRSVEELEWVASSIDALAGRGKGPVDGRLGTLIDRARFARTSESKPGR